MKAKNIERHLRRKVDDWLESIEDEEVRKLADANAIIMGGAIASLLLDAKVNDYDIYFKTKEACLAIARYYVDRFKENPPPHFAGGRVVDISVIDDEDRITICVKSAGVAGEESGEEEYGYFEGYEDPANQEAFLDAAVKAMEVIADDDDKKPYRPIFLSRNAITLSDKVQIIVRFHGEPTDIRKSYDFVHLTNYWVSWGKSGYGKLTLLKDALECLLARELRVVPGGSRYPFAAICRIRKFLGRGFHITAGDILKLCLAINELNLRDYKLLEEQLTGVDWAYFQEMLSYLDAHKDEAFDSEGNLKVPYVMDLIERIL